MQPTKERSATVKTIVIEVLSLGLLCMGSWLFAIKARMYSFVQPHLRLQTVFVNFNGSDFLKK